MMNNNFVKGFEILTKASHNNDSYGFANRHSEQLVAECLTENFVILNFFQNLKIFGWFRIALESINLFSIFRIRYGMTDVCHSEKIFGTERSLYLVGEGRVRYEQPLSPNFINNPVIASPSGR